MPAPISTSSCGNRRIKSIGKCPMTPGGIETGIGALSWQIRTALFYLDMVPDPVGQSGVGVVIRRGLCAVHRRRRYCCGLLS